MQGSGQGKRWRLAGAVLLAVVLYALAHPPLGFAPLAWFATAPVWAVLLDRRAPVRVVPAALAGAAFGVFATWATVGPWTWEAAEAWYDGRTSRTLLLVAGLPLLGSGLALHYAAAFAAVSRLAGLGAFAGVLGGAGWMALAEHTRSTFLDGNPWASIASALSPATADSAAAALVASQSVVGLLAFGGPPLVAFAATACAAAVGLAWAERGDAVARGRALGAGALVVVPLVLVTSFVRGFSPLRTPAEVPDEPLRVALVQGGVGRGSPWTGSGAADSVARHVELTRLDELRGADLVVWPENALPFLLDANPDRRRRLRDLARELGVALMIGGTRTAKQPVSGVGTSDGTGTPAPGATRTVVHNSVFLFPADGGEPAVYDKRRLLPFVEEVPAWAAALASSPWRGAYAAGGGEGVFEVAGWRVAPLLCFEAIHEDEASARVREGADLLVNLSNDSWFDRGAGPEQHFALAALRAVETRRPMVRVATTGVSALVAEDGLTSWRLPTGTGAVALLDVVPPHRDSLFVRGGRDATLALLLLVAVGSVLLPSIAGRRSGEEASSEA